MERVQDAQGRAPGLDPQGQGLQAQEEPGTESGPGVSGGLERQRRGGKLLQRDKIHTEGARISKFAQSSSRAISLLAPLAAVGRLHGVDEHDPRGRGDLLVRGPRDHADRSSVEAEREESQVQAARRGDQEDFLRERGHLHAGGAQASLADPRGEPV